MEFQCRRALSLVVLLHTLGAAAATPASGSWYLARAFSQAVMVRFVAEEAQSSLAPIVLCCSRSTRLLCTSCASSSMKFCGSPALVLGPAVFQGGVRRLLPLDVWSHSE